MKLTQPHTGRLSVFGFQTHDTQPEPNPLSFWQSITIFRPDPARSRRYLTKSRPGLNGSNQILARSRQIRPDFGQISPGLGRFRPDLDGFGYISTRSRRIWPDFFPGEKPETDPTRPEIDEIRTEKSNHLSGSISGHIFLHSNNSGRV